jgi:hypothetical protein
MRRMLRTFRFSAMLILSLAIGISGCKRNNSPSTQSGAQPGPLTSSGVPSQFRDLSKLPGTVFDVTYTPNTVRIDLPTVQRALKSVSRDARVFLFDASDSRISSLKEGNIMFLEHLGVRRVTGTVRQGAQVAVVTDEASLPDFIQKGRIEFSVPVDFRKNSARSFPQVNPSGVFAGIMQRLFPVVYASEENKGKLGLHAKGEVDNWEFELEGEPEGEGVSLSLDVGKKVAGLTVSIKSKGELEKITTGFKAVVSGNAVQQFQYNTPLEGKLHVGWDLITDAPGSGIGEARLKLPPFAKDVFDVYGLPLLFRIDEALIFKPGFEGKKDAAEGGVDITFNGSGGLSVQGAEGGGQSTPEGSMTGEPTLEKTTAESLAAHGVVLAIDAPKVSVSLGTESITEAIQEAVPGAILDKAAEALEEAGLGGLIKKAKEDFFKIEGAAYVQLVTEFDYAGSGPLSVVPCSMTHLNFYAQAGADAQLLAIKGESPHLDLYKTSKTIRDPDIDACGKK